MNLIVKSAEKPSRGPKMTSGCISGAVCRGHESDSEVSGEAIQRTQNDFGVYPTTNKGIYGRYDYYSKVVHVRRAKVNAARHWRTYRVGQNEI
ncbi:hypothetical protein DPMN_165044 [Dreissena polymorpha]|uniref:Uncharacterized protein n=1 Tax=Dreissena polymorpha TaxID=45954 RepID=A0A9D4EYW7_DREPO|nr:hypothetical protein DPMN_165044 [Dreissena polymorpha]